jgi:hypothetical protein
LNAVYGSLNIPRALARDSRSHATAPPPADAPFKFEVPAALAAPAGDARELETPAERVPRLTQLVKAYTLAQAHTLPAFAAALPADGGFEASESFWQFSERILAAAMRRLYRPEGVEALLAQLGEREVDKKMLAQVHMALSKYAPEDVKPPMATPLLERIRCVRRQV